MSDEDKISQKYQRKSDREFILLRPDSYVGSMEKETTEQWIYNRDSRRMNKEHLTYTPSFLKIFDEILVNAIDHHVRSESNEKDDYYMNNIKVTKIKIIVDRENNTISVENDGHGIPIILHNEEKMYIPEMVFGYFKTSSNYDDSEERIVGGKNGHGAKLTNLFSQEFTVETVDKKARKKFFQVYNNNMLDKTEPEIIPYNKVPFTKITYKPDYTRFYMEGIDDATFKMLEKRSYDMCACTSDNVHIYLDDERLLCKTFEQYVNLYLGYAKETPRVHQVLVDKKRNYTWEVIMAMSPDGEHENISFVNGVYTKDGGTHVNYIFNKFCTKLKKAMAEQPKYKNVTLSNENIKRNVVIFLKSTVVNPTFTSQTKDLLTTPSGKFGFQCDVDIELAKEMIKMGLVKRVIELEKYKEQFNLSKTDGRMVGTIRGIPKLKDARNAGKKNLAKNCTLIITEGDSAKTLAISGLKALPDPENYGVYPLRGKLLNVRVHSNKKMLENQEITELKKILGLQQNKNYENIDELRYGKVIFFTDQDLDGFHIKALCMNFVHYFWHELLKLEFCLGFKTPIIKATKNKTVKTFYTLQEFEKWNKTYGKGYNIKYYKGLGTSTPKEATEYFNELDKHLTIYKYDRETDKYITLAFDKTKADQRKDWLSEHDKNNIIENDVKEVSYSDFFNKELIHFSNYDCERSLPDIDGLKPCQRKTLWTTFTKKLKSEIKVAQLAGSIGELADYHHGEASLQGAIIGMAQNYVGSNNINLLSPCGQFGSRIKNGKDHASPRYIFTKINDVTKTIYKAEDDILLQYSVSDQGKPIEPISYKPVIVMPLVNGAAGIGTGWSTSIPSFNPVDIVANIRRMLDGEEMVEMIPWYQGFKGKIVKDKNRYECKGVWTRLDYRTIEITELPVRSMCYDTYKEKLEKMVRLDKKKQLAEGTIVDYEDDSNDNDVCYRVKFDSKARLDKLIKDNKLEKMFKLKSNINMTNMHLYFDGKIKKYDDVLDIIRDYYPQRLELYTKRKEYMLSKLEKECDINKQRVRFIESYISDIIIFKKNGKPIKKSILEEKLNELQFPEVKMKNESSFSYNYLLNMSISSLTEEKVNTLRKELEIALANIEELKGKTNKDLWKEDLDEFMVAYNKYKKEWANERKVVKVTKKAVRNPVKRGKK